MLNIKVYIPNISGKSCQKWLKIMPKSFEKCAKILFLLFFAAISESAIQFTLPEGCDDYVKVSPEAGLRDTVGIILKREKTATYNCKFSKKLPYKPNFWQRSLIKIPLTSSSTHWYGAIDKSFSLYLISFSDESNNQPPNGSIRFSILQSRENLPNTYTLQLEVLTSSDRATAPRLQSIITVDSEYCIESNIKFTTADSISVSLLINGKTVGSLNALIPVIERKCINIYSGTLAHGFEEPLTVFVSDFEISDSQPFLPPPRPAKTAIRVENGRSVTNTSKFTSLYSGEFIREVEWQCYKAGDTAFPLFDMVITDPAKFYECATPFSLDSGSYLFRLRWKNNFNKWGHFSIADTVLINSNPERAFQIARAALFTVNHKKELAEIENDSYYSLRISFSATTDLLKMAYLVAILRHESYPYGHAGNKGEKFQPFGNYIVNISREQNGFSVFEKNIEGSSVTQKLNVSDKGLYIDESSLVVDSLNSIVSVNIRLLDKAKEGNWQGIVYGRDSHDVISNTFRFHFSVCERKSLGNIYKVIAVVVVASFIALCWLIRRKKKSSAAPLVYAKEFETIRKYIAENMAEKLTIDIVRAKLGINTNRFYDIMRANNAEFPNVVNVIRIEKAKELLLNTETTIASVGFDVGYSKPGYFSQIFKEQTGVTPVEYRRTNGRLSR